MRCIRRRLRCGEALGLKWAAVDLDNAVLSVTQTVKRVKGKGLLLERTAKTQKSLRMLPFPAFAVTALKNHRERQQQERLLAGDDWREHGLVLTSTIGTPIESRNLLRHFHATLKALAIAPRRFHDLRHTAASLLIAQGASLHDVKRFWGTRRSGLPPTHTATHTCK